MTPKPARGAVRQRPAHRYAALRRSSGARPQSLAVSAVTGFLVAAVEIMKEVREGLERAFGPHLTEAEIERRTQEREQEAEARERFRAAADEMARWQEFWDEQRRRAEEAAQPQRMQATSCAFEIQLGFRQAALPPAKPVPAWRGFDFDGVAPDNPLGFFDGDEAYQCEEDFDTAPEHDYHAF